MNNSILSLHSKNRYSIKILEINKHLVSGMFNVIPHLSNIPFTGIIDDVSKDLYSTSFIIQWPCQNDDLTFAQTAFTGYLKLSTLNPLLSLDWIKIQRFKCAPNVDFTVKGKSILCQNHQPEIDLQTQQNQLPYPEYKSNIKHMPSSRFEPLHYITH